MEPSLNVILHTNASASYSRPLSQFFLYSFFQNICERRRIFKDDSEILLEEHTVYGLRDGIIGMGEEKGK